jgi:formylglycine-generating enzyme required for sulfatase activity
MRSRLARPSLVAVLRAGAWLALVQPGCSLRSLDELEQRGLREAEPGPLLERSCDEGMRPIYYDDGGSFCIDRLETTRAEFDEFLSMPPEPNPVPRQAEALCYSFAGAAPRGGEGCTGAYELGRDPELPVTCVTLCEAAAYCQFRGKRLCGGRDGEPILNKPVQSGLEDADQDEWFRACAGDGARPYPHGEAEDGSCNIKSGALLPSGASTQCATPEGVLDLSGNVSEWTLICRKRDQQCLLRGGEFLTSNSALARCQLVTFDTDTVVPPLSSLPDQRLPGAGIRCCSD